MPLDAAVDRPQTTNLSLCLYTHYQYVYTPDPLLKHSRHQAMKALMAKAANEEFGPTTWTHTVTIRLKKLGRCFVPGRRASERPLSNSWTSSSRALNLSIRPKLRPVNWLIYTASIVLVAALIKTLLYLVGREGKKRGAAKQPSI